jgi:TonB family protein
MPIDDKIAAERDSMQSESAGSEGENASMSLRAFAAAACLILPIGAPARSAPLQPSDKWHVFFDEAQCLAQRNYGSKERPIYLILKQPALGDVLQVAVAKGAVISEPTEFDGSFAFDNQAAQKASFLIFRPKGEKLTVYSANVPLAGVEPARAAKTLKVRVKGLDETFSLASMGDLLSIMGSCASDLAKYWNIDESGADVKIAQHAKGNLRPLFSADDYPTQALMFRETGRVKVALLVNESGRVEDCSVIETSRVAVLDAQACAIIKERAKFAPAVGKDGKPAKDGFVQTINWGIG